MEPSVEVAIIIFLVLIAHYLIFYFLTRKKKNIDGKLKTSQCLHKIQKLNWKIHHKTGKHVVVTGGSSGIGLWIAIYAARMGADVTIVARNTKLLGKFYFCSTHRSIPYHFV